MIEEINKSANEMANWLENTTTIQSLGAKSLANKIRTGAKIFEKALDLQVDGIFISDHNSSVHYSQKAKEFLDQMSGDQLELFQVKENKQDWTSLKHYIESTNSRIQGILSVFITNKHLIEQILYFNFFSEAKIDNKAKLALYEIQATAKEVKKLEEEIIKTKNELDKAVENKLAESIKKIYDGEFTKLEGEFKTKSDIWLKRLRRTIFLFFVYGLLALFSIFIDFPKTFELWIIPIKIPDNFAVLAVINTLIVSLLSWMTFFFSRNYSINKNLEYIYKQKHTMLQVYPAYSNIFDKIGIDRDKVTAELGKLVFDIPYTGFLKHDGSSNDTSPNIITNIVDRLK